MFNSTITTSAVFSVVMLISDAQATQKWKKHGKDDGVVVYTSNHVTSSVPNVKAVTVVDAPSNDVWRYITESMNIDGLKESKNLGNL